MGQTSHHTPSAARCGWVIRGAGEAVALGVVGLMLASVVVLWNSNGGWDQLLVSPIAFFYSASRLLGLLSAVLVLLQVAAMARIPLVESAVGHHRLTSYHRLAGFTSFWLIVVHSLFAVFAHSGGFVADMVATVWEFTTEYPGMLLALASFVLFVVVVATSIRSARRSMRYENWHLIHLYGYLAAALAVPHMIWMGTDLQTPWIRWTWVGAWVAVFAAALLFRLALPAYLSRRHDVRVTSVRSVAPDAVEVLMTGNDLSRLGAEAGQYFVWRFEGPGRSRGVPLSISSAPTDTSLVVTGARVGRKTARLADLKPGTRVYLEGPYGRFTAGNRHSDKVVLAASGSGIMPIKAVLSTLPDEVDAVVILRGHEGAVYYREEIERLCAERDATCHVLEGPRAFLGARSSWQPAGSDGLPAIADDDADALRRLVPHIAERDVYICGSTGWMKRFVDAVRAVGVGPRAVHVERFGI